MVLLDPSGRGGTSGSAGSSGSSGSAEISGTSGSAESKWNIRKCRIKYQNIRKCSPPEFKGTADHGVQVEVQNQVVSESQSRTPESAGNQRSK
jgi:hypothetical protein